MRAVLAARQSRGYGGSMPVRWRLHCRVAVLAATMDEKGRQEPTGNGGRRRVRTASLLIRR